MIRSVNAIILSGGLGKRLEGKEKGLLPFGKTNLIEHKIENLKNFFDEIIIVTNNPQTYQNTINGKCYHGLEIHFIADIGPGKGPLMGLYTGLIYSSEKTSLITTSDTPFLKTKLITYLIKIARTHTEYEVIVPMWKGFFEPLCGIYTQNCIPSIKHCLQKGKITSFYQYVRVIPLPEHMVKKIDPQGMSFFNINTWQEYQKALEYSDL